ncbi:MAG TPA: alpha/beta hydrolase [Solirubrobacterales bacterium]|nr:alpha/beta hydrolase [Solirubrobacterales bacterium]
MAKIRSSELEAIGMRTPLVEAGPEKASEAVVLLHGNPGSREDWRQLLPAIGEVGRAIAFDLPGFGGADKPGYLDYSAGTYATFIGAAIERLGVERAHLVMHDLGGTGLLWAAAHPSAVGSLCLIDTGILLDFRWHWTARMYRAPLIGGLMVRTTTRSGFRAAMRLYNPQPRPLPEDAIERMWRDYVPATRRAAQRFYRATPAEVMQLLRPALSALDPPALVIWGAHDPAVPVEQAERQRESLPSAEVVVLGDSGHWPMLDDPAGVEAALLPFLRRHVG